MGNTLRSSNATPSVQTDKYKDGTTITKTTTDDGWTIVTIYDPRGREVIVYSVPKGYGSVIYSGYVDHRKVRAETERRLGIKRPANCDHQTARKMRKNDNTTKDHPDSNDTGDDEPEDNDEYTFITSLTMGATTRLTTTTRIRGKVTVKEVERII